MAQIKNIKKPGDLIRGAKVGVAGLDKDGNVVSLISTAANEGKVMTIADDGTVGFEDPNVAAELDKKYKIVACVLRYENGAWGQIGGAHAPINVKSVEDGGGANIKINYSFKAKKVVSFVACPDEDFANQGNFIGSSVGDEFAYVYFVTQRPVSIYASYDNGVWSTSDSNYSVSGTTGQITVTHPSFADVGRSIICKSGNPVGYVSFGATSDTFSIKDFTGTELAALHSSFQIVLQFSAMKAVSMASSALKEGGNVWCFGIFEV